MFSVCISLGRVSQRELTDSLDGRRFLVECLRHDREKFTAGGRGIGSEAHRFQCLRRPDWSFGFLTRAEVTY